MFEVRPTVLVVEDNNDFRKMMRENFDGEKLIITSSYEEATIAIHDNENDEVASFVDLHLAGIHSGFEFLDYLKRNLSSRVFAYAWTADTSDETYGKVPRMGGYGIVPKWSSRETLHDYAFHSPALTVMRNLSTDDLTGLLTKRRFNEVAHNVLLNVGTRQQSKVVSVILIDVDNFKEINDTYGHPKADEVLKEFGFIIRNHHSLRETDFKGRIGGDEAAILIPGADRGTAIEIASRIQHAVEDAAWYLKLPFGISVGAEEISAEDISARLEGVKMLPKEERYEETKKRIQSCWAHLQEQADIGPCGLKYGLYGKPSKDERSSKRSKTNSVA